MSHLLIGQSKSAVLLLCGALWSACGGKALQINESSKPDAQSGASGAGAAGSTGACACREPMTGARAESLAPTIQPCLLKPLALGELPDG